MPPPGAPRGGYGPPGGYGYGYGPAQPAGMGSGRVPGGLAGAGSRFLARLLDGGIILVIGTVLSTVLIATHVVSGFFSGGVLSGYQTYNLTWVFCGAYFFYDWLQHAFWDGQTVGKRALRLRAVSRRTGQPPGLGRQAARSAIFTLPPALPSFLGFFGFIFWLLDVLWHLWDRPYQQCVHDKPAGTVVINR